MMRTLVLAGALAAILAPPPAGAHEAPPTGQQPVGWTYPWACCSGQDCGRADGDVTEGPDGYVIGHTGEVVPYGDRRVKDSPDGEFHWCAHRAGIDAGRTICLFVPPRGF
jgi:hypothetical protein